MVCYRYGMPAVHIRNLDDAVVDALKRRARSNNRSLEAELRAILESVSVENENEQAGDWELRTVAVPQASDISFSREDIYEDGDQ